MTCVSLCDGFWYAAYVAWPNAICAPHKWNTNSFVWPQNTQLMYSARTEGVYRRRGAFLQDRPSVDHLGPHPGEREREYNRRYLRNLPVLFKKYFVGIANQRERESSLNPAAAREVFSLRHLCCHRRVKSVVSTTK